MDSISVLSGALNADIQQLNLIGQNLSNVNTTAYKRQAFASVVDKTFNTDLLATPVRSQTVLEQGALTYTGNNFHVALDGSSFLAVRHNNSLSFTRKGELAVDGNGLLTLISGQKVQGQSGDIQLQPGGFTISEQGEVIQDGRVIDQFAQYQLTEQPLPIGSGLYQDVQAVQERDLSMVRQGFLEASNVNHLQEMVRLVETVRHYEASSQVLQGYNAILEEAVTNLAQF
ncbi:flagellar hook-basal body protein [Parendozoicomonas haliclonae]|uniref:Flagellar basal-body rod protein FlgG n=1 Tax=Parendozoicomonas haliclonae TaxID=1960125 RepID=A0A1X7ANK2_9GAMM|nr:flagellar hook basal-body protein [Parendozoicomonas haliclonae]SMA49874.1 Flagellar basal-body rod protein FlgG [Parendozoicomonas haliclonae]